MRPSVKNLRLPLMFTLANVLAVAPVMAQDAPAIAFVPSTGIETADLAYDAPVPLPFADAGAPKRDVRDAEADMIAMGDKMSDPDMQDNIANMVEKMGDAMMRMPVGKFANAIEKARPGTVQRRIRDRDTIADIAGRDAREMPEMLGKQSRVAMNMMGGFAKAFASMMPEFEKMGREMEASMADLETNRR